MLALSLLLSACDTKDLEIPNIPMDMMDESFKAFLLEDFDLDKDGEISIEEAAMVKEMWCSGIASFEGIQYFPNLEKFECWNVGATTIDVSQNTALKSLKCYYGFIELDVSNNHALDTLICVGDNNTKGISSLKINPELKFLNVQYNSLGSLDISGNKSLKTLYCNSPRLTSLDVSNSVLDSLFCTNPVHALNEIKIEGCTSLKHISISVKGLPLVLRNCPSIESVNARGLSHLDVSDSPLLKELACVFESNTSDLDISKNPLLEDLSISGRVVYRLLDLNSNLQIKNLKLVDCYINDNLDLSNLFQLVNITFSHCIIGDFRNIELANRKSLKTFYYYGLYAEDKVEKIDLSGCTSLESVYINENLGGILKMLNLSGCQALSELKCTGRSSLTEINLQGCSNLENLQCQENNLSSLDLKDCTNLLFLNCSSNKISSLDLKNCPNLSVLNCFSNLINELNLDACTTLTELDCGYCHQITTLKINNEYLTRIDCSNIGSLTKIEILKGSNLKSLTCNDTRELTDLVLSGCQSLEWLSCSNNYHELGTDFRGKLATLNINDCKSLRSLTCDFCSLTSLDVSNCQLLEYLNCSYNQLNPTLDVSKCINMNKLNCVQNKLNELIINRNIPIQNISKDPSTQLVIAD